MRSRGLRKFPITSGALLAVPGDAKILPSAMRGRPRKQPPMRVRLRLAAVLLGMTALVFLRVASSLGAETQQAGQVHRIGLISVGGPLTPAAFTDYFRPMVEQLRADGWVEGQNITLHSRFDEGKRERLSGLVAELVNLKVSAIVALGTPAALAAKNATATIPILMVNVADPVRSGLVATLRQPGGNVTGMAMLGPELAFKQLEVMKEIAPQATTLAVMFDPQNSAQVELLADNVSVAARAASLQLHPIEVAATTPLDAAFVEIRRKQVDLLLVYPLSRPSGWDRETSDLAVKYRLPAFGVFPVHAEHGLLLSVGPSAKEQLQRTATYIDRILRGATPRDLPVEQPTQFQVVVNLKTAKALGLTIPRSILLRADRVIE